MKKLTAFLFFTFGISFFTFSQNINTVAGSANAGYGGDGGPATIAEMQDPIGVIVDASGNLYIGDYGNNRVRKVSGTGIITTIAGTGVGGFNGDNIQATAAEINGPGGLGIDTAGNVYISELLGARIRKVDVSTGIITTVAGNGSGGFSGDGFPATVAQISFPTDVKFDKKGNMYIADDGNSRIRKVNGSTGIIHTIAGNGVASYSGDGGPATAAEMSSPTGIAIDTNGNVYIGDQVNYRIRIVDTSHIINTYAGNGIMGFSGNGGPATDAELNHPEEVALDAYGNLYIDDEGSDEIRMANTNGTISRFAGRPGVASFSGDGGLAVSAELNGPQGVCLDKAGNVYIADYSNSRIREVTGVTTGINNVNNESSISIYPNPAKEELNVALNGLTGEISLTLFNIQAKEIFKQSYADKKTITLNIAAITAGTYILRIQKAGVATFIRKVEIQK